MHAGFGGGLRRRFSMGNDSLFLVLLQIVPKLSTANFSHFGTGFKRYGDHSLRSQYERFERGQHRIFYVDSHYFMRCFGCGRSFRNFLMQMLQFVLHLVVDTVYPFILIINSMNESL